jgi:hypothetical protein
MLNAHLSFLGRKLSRLRPFLSFKWYRMKAKIQITRPTKPKTAKVRRPMTIILSVLLVTVIVSSTLFLILLFKLSLEDADFWLRPITGALSFFTFFAIAGALTTGYFVGKRQNVEIARANESAAKANERTATAELRLEMLSRWRNKKETPRWQFLGDLPEYLRGKRTGVAEILYAPSDDEEPFFLATLLAEALNDAGWTITRRDAISADDPSQLMNPEALIGKPLLLRVGGSKGRITIWAKNMPTTASASASDAPGAVLASALMKCSLDVYGWTNERLPDGFVRIVIGQKE